MQNWEEMFDRRSSVSRPGYDLHGKHIAAALRELPPDALTLVEVPAGDLVDRLPQRAREPADLTGADGVAVRTKRQLYAAEPAATNDGNRR